eukprot:COSAG02_NODE_5736_length_4079_cov_3.219598_3_plen_69_part_00
MKVTTLDAGLKASLSVVRGWQPVSKMDLALLLETNTNNDAHNTSHNNNASPEPAGAQPTFLSMHTTSP